jgi:hypothetical protein
MSFLIATPEIVSTAATDLSGVASTLGAANSAAAASITEVLPAAFDEVSTGIAALLGAHGQAYQAVSAQAAAFHQEFVKLLGAGANAYATAEANVGQTLTGGATGAVAADSELSVLQRIEQLTIEYNTGLVARELEFNQWLVQTEVGLEERIFGTDSALNGVINRGFNVGNLLFVNTGEEILNGLSGAQVPSTFNASVLVGNLEQTFNGGQIGGPVGAFEQSLSLGLNAVGLIGEILVPG